jgi:hypothetical protein
MKVVVVGATAGQPVDQPRGGVEGKDDGPGFGKQDIEGCITQSMRMLALQLEFHEIDHITTRILSSGKCSRNMETAASVYSVGPSPHQAIAAQGACRQ